MMPILLCGNVFSCQTLISWSPPACPSFPLINLCLLLCPNPASASFGGAFEGQLRHNAARRISQFKGSSECGILFPLFGGFTATILRGLTYPKILCALEKVERKRENVDIAWRRSLSRAWAAEIVTVLVAQLSFCLLTINLFMVYLLVCLQSISLLCLFLPTLCAFHFLMTPKGFH